MQFTALLAVLSLGLLASASPAQVTRDLDWKYAVGWDGVTLPADSIGSAVATTDALETRENRLQKRHVGGVFICTDVNWGGDCGYAIQPLNTCIVLGSEWKDKISSFGPDPCTKCFGYGTSDCTVAVPPNGDSSHLAIWQFENPGSATGGLTQPGQFPSTNPWNDKIASFKCVQTC